MTTVRNHEFLSTHKVILKKRMQKAERRSTHTPIGIIRQFNPINIETHFSVYAKIQFAFFFCFA